MFNAEPTTTSATLDQIIAAEKAELAAIQARHPALRGEALYDMRNFLRDARRMGWAYNEEEMVVHILHQQDLPKD